MIRVEIDPKAKAFLSHWLGGALDALLPERCAGCGVEGRFDDGLCPACLDAVPFLTPPFCRICSAPTPFAAAIEPICADCAREPPAFSIARAAAAHQGLARALALGLKHGQRLGDAKPLAAWMAEAGASLLDDATLIAPVPLHWTRLARRGFNQSAILAQRLGAIAQRPAALDLLRKIRPSPPQQGLSAAARRANLAAADFAIAPGRAVEGERVLLIDDVLTTGVTLNACARVLLRAGAVNVAALTATRVANAADDTI